MMNARNDECQEWRMPRMMNATIAGRAVLGGICWHLLAFLGISWHFLAFIIPDSSISTMKRL